MKGKELGRIGQRVFGTDMQAAGFIWLKDKPLWYRKLSEEIGHFITLVPSIHGGTFQVLVFPSGPAADSDFERTFPNVVTVPTWYRNLNDIQGVSDYQQWFKISSEDAEIVLEKQVKPLLPAAFAFLARLISWKDIEPFLDNVVLRDMKQSRVL